jgi:hypothetical protein
MLMKLTPDGRSISNPSESGQIIYPTHDDTESNERTAVVELSPSNLERPVTGYLRLTEVKYGVQVSISSTFYVKLLRS